MNSLAYDAYPAVMYIDSGRKGWAAKGKGTKGRISYFTDGQTSADLQALILAEYTFLCQELQLCSENDSYSLTSLTQVKQSFDDAFLAFQIVEVW